MADNDRPKMSTCPICGYTDTADDADALQMAIEEHIKLSHNLNPANLGGTAGSVQSVSNATAAEVNSNPTTGATVPIIAAAPNNGGAGAGTGAGVGVLGAAALVDSEDNTRTGRND